MLFGDRLVLVWAKEPWIAERYLTNTTERSVGGCEITLTPVTFVIHHVSV